MRWMRPHEVPTLGNWFRAAGYDTHYDGKWHISHADLMGDDGTALATNDDDGNVDQAAPKQLQPHLVDLEDHRIWVKDLRRTWYGDANLDGEFNSGDMVQVFAEGKYEKDAQWLNVTSWSEGDWNGDGIFDSSDMVTAFSDGGYEQGHLFVIQAPPDD